MISKRLTGPVLYIANAEEEADILYRTGFSAPGKLVFLEERNGKRHLIVSDLEFKRAQRVASECHIWRLTDFELFGKPVSSLAGSALALINRLKLKKVNVSRTFPYGCASILIDNGVELVIHDKPFYRQREIKSESEIRLIRQSQRAANDAMLAAWRLIKSAEIGKKKLLFVNGTQLTSDLVRAEINKTLLDHNCVGTGTIVACGSQAADPHESGYGPLYANESIVIDIFPRHDRHGYWGDLTRTFVRGKASPALRKMYNAVYAAQKAALSRIRHGAIIRSVHMACEEEFERRGLETESGEGFIHSTGHGLGLEIHENPTLSSSGDKLRAGNVITVEPGLYYHATGGIRIEDVVLVTDTGYRYIAGLKNFFEI
ncbi:MAG: aminopeptidase P family protein [Lentisphaerae bacterium]|nr:aminopeptidase P family protein [Lentisphaerota bacterium]